MSAATVVRRSTGPGCVTSARAQPLAPANVFRTLWPLAMLFGLYMTLEGYRAFEGDQAYRLPLLLHQQNAQLYAHDPFVRAFDEFNPHRGYLTLLDAPSRLLGLPATLFLYFTATFCVTGVAIARITRAVWPDQRPLVAWVAFMALLCTKAGNIGTNHLFEPMLLDRLVALALGWTALAELLEAQGRFVLTVPVLLCCTQFVHPSLGLQLAGLVGASLCAYMVMPAWVEIRRGHCAAALALLALSLLPAVLAIPAQSARLFAGLSIDRYLTLAAYVQSPQHMIPHLWRAPQWLAWLILVGLAIAVGGLAVRSPTPGHTSRVRPSAPRRRLAVVLGIALVVLAIAWFAIEVLHNARLTVFQPFRLATVVRGLCLVVLANHGLSLVRRNTWEGRCRALVLLVGLTSDWCFAVVGATELLATMAERYAASPRAVRMLLVMCWSLAFFYLMRHDTQAGHVRLSVALAVGTGMGALSALKQRMTSSPLTRGGAAAFKISPFRVLAAVYVLPAFALIAAYTAPTHPPNWQLWLLNHIRLVERPVDDIERLATWCRENTPDDAIFIGPPGPKGFRLWSRRAVAFNRAASPYHAAGLRDWAERYCAHVGLPSAEQLAVAYLDNRHKLEKGFESLDGTRLTRLAAQQGAQYAITTAAHRERAGHWLRPLHAQGRWVVSEVVFDPGPTSLLAGTPARAKDMTERETLR